MGYNNFNSHAHVERDLWDCICLFFVWDFNSHAHVERDPIHRSPLLLREISTHTLTWSVTIRNDKGERVMEHFNSHAHVERDAFSILSTIVAVDFNSHAHVERDS